MHYLQNGSWSINNTYDIHDSTNIVEGSLIAHGVTLCIIHCCTERNKDWGDVVT